MKTHYVGDDCPGGHRNDSKAVTKAEQLAMEKCPVCNGPGGLEGLRTALKLVEKTPCCQGKGLHYPGLSRVCSRCVGDGRPCFECKDSSGRTPLKGAEMESALWEYMPVGWEVSKEGDSLFCVWDGSRKQGEETVGRGNTLQDALATAIGGK